MQVRRVVAVLCLILVASIGAWVLRDAWWLEGTAYGELTVAPELPAEVSLGDGYLARFEPSAAGERLVIAHRDGGGKALWSSVPGRAFVAAARGQVSASHASASDTPIDDAIDGRCIDQQVTLMTAASDRGPALIEGTLDCAGQPWPWGMVLVPQGPRRIRFDLELAAGDSRAPNRVLLIEHRAREEAITALDATRDLRGHDRWATGGAAAGYLTATMQGFVLASPEPSRIDLRRPDATVISMLGPHMQGYILRGADRAALVAAAALEAQPADSGGGER